MQQTAARTRARCRLWRVHCWCRASSRRRRTRWLGREGQHSRHLKPRSFYGVSCILQSGHLIDASNLDRGRVAIECVLQAKADAAKTQMKTQNRQRTSNQSHLMGLEPIRCQQNAHLFFHLLLAIFESLSPFCRIKHPWLTMTSEYTANVMPELGVEPGISHLHLSACKNENGK